MEESKAGDIRLAPQLPSQVEGEQEQHRQGIAQDAGNAAAAVAAVSMGDLSLEEEKAAGVSSSKDEEASLQEEKHDFFFDGAPDGLRCSVGFCLMTEAVVAMDGFAYQKSSLDEYIAHCTAKGQPLTSPMTDEPTSGMYIPMQNVRTLVKDYMEQREKEWALHLAQRRAERQVGK